MHARQLDQALIFFSSLAGLKSLKDLTITLYRETDLTPLAEIDSLEGVSIDTPEKMDKNYAEKITEEAVTPLQELRPDLKIKVHIYE